MVIQKMVIHYIMNVLVQNTLTKIKRRQAGKVYDTFLILTYFSVDASSPGARKPTVCSCL